MEKTLTIKNLNDNFTINQLMKLKEFYRIMQHLFIRNIFIKNLSEETITIKNINVDTSISQLKNKTYEIKGIPSN